jgi:spoIIIJ-associated protein
VDDGVEFAGRTVDDALAQAEAETGASRDDLDIEVVSQGSRGVFGLGAESARVRVRRRVPVAATEGVKAQVAPGAEESPIAVQEAPQADTRRPSAVADTTNLPEEACDVLRQLLGTMGFNAEVSVRSRQDPLMLAISGTNLGVLIGRRGDNLAALQFMVNLILSKNRRQWPRIVIDVENYRERREQSLRTLADRIAYRVERSQRPFTLEAMPAGDRRVIHLALRDRSDIETYSIGEGAARRVVIAPKRPQQVSAGRY